MKKEAKIDRLSTNKKYWLYRQTRIVVLVCWPGVILLASFTAAFAYKCDTVIKNAPNQYGCSKKTWYQSRWKNICIIDLDNLRRYSRKYTLLTAVKDIFSLSWVSFPSILCLRQTRITLQLRIFWKTHRLGFLFNQFQIADSSWLLEDKENSFIDWLQF